MTHLDKQRKPPVDPERASRILIQVLGLAEALPFRPQAELPYPPLKTRLAEVRKMKISQLHLALTYYLDRRQNAEGVRDLCRLPGPVDRLGSG